jgi:hypothetical protein
MCDETQITALREEIRRAGQGIDRIWSRFVRAIGYCGWTALVATLLLAVTVGHAGWLDPWFWLAATMVAIAAGITVVVTVTIAGCALIVVPASAIWREIHTRRIRRRLAVLTYDERAAVLLPLWPGRLGATRELVEPLIRELRLHSASELAPATLPDGRGDETAPA